MVNLTSKRWGGGPVGQTAIGSGLTVGGRGGSGLQPLEILDFGIKILPLERIQQEAFAASRLGPASHQPSSPPFLVCCPRGQSHRLQAMALQRHHGIGLGPPAAHRSLCYSMVYIKTVKTSFFFHLAASRLKKNDVFKNCKFSERACNT